MTKLLVANRGEIACRVIRAARALGLATVAVYSQADEDAPHARLADQAVAIGGALPRESYLDVQKLLRAAELSGADAVHPGYGFLAENADFAAACAWVGLTWVGPPPEAIALMGDKARAKARMQAAGVPTVPGWQGEDQSPAALEAAAREVGFPLLLKAAAGGGGRGMRRVHALTELGEALLAARAEAERAFGDGRLLMERLIEGARHVEVQVLADGQGNVIHLGERDCSAQRRYQKVVEEAPSPAVDEALRARMGAAAVAAAAAIGYRSAGTVELLLAPGGEFYFLEMNTRIQVEHPVTELVTGLDLVQEQLRVALGEPLSLRQEDVRLRGHAIEARLYAEEPGAGFAPRTGRVELWEPPAGEGLRCDHGLSTGLEVRPYYDPMLAKLIAWGETRELARRRLVRALRETALLGVPTNKRFLLELLSHPAFVAGELHTGSLEGELRQALLPPEPPPSGRLLALAAALILEAPRASGPGQLADGWRAGRAEAAPLALRVDEGVHALRVTRLGPTRTRVEVGGAVHEVELRGPKTAGQVRVRVDDLEETARLAWSEGPRLWLELADRAVAVEEERPRARAGAADAGSDGTLRAPVSGVVVAVPVAPGARVERGQVAVVVEAMKIQTPVAVPLGGTVAEVRVRPGDQVERRHVLVVVAPDGSGGG